MRLRLLFLLPLLGCATTQRPPAPLPEPIATEAPGVPAEAEQPPVVPAAEPELPILEVLLAPEPEDVPLPPRPPREPFAIEPLPRDPAKARRAHKAGVAALKARDAPEAIARLSECVALDARRGDCRWELGWALFSGARWRDAEDVWNEVAKRRPNDQVVTRALELVGPQARLGEWLDEVESQPVPPLAPPLASARLRLRAVGDVMLGTTVPEGYLPPDDGATILDAVKPLLEDADLTFVNLEGPLCDSGRSTKCRRPSNTCYAFRTPVHYGDYLQGAGVDLASIANNHTGDFGDDCRRATEAALDARAIAWSGPPGTVASLEKNGLQVAMIAFHTAPTTNSVLDVETARRLVRQTARTHHVVLVSFHGGAEGASQQRVPHGRELFVGEDRGDLRAFTRAVVDAGADLVIGHGPHVLRGMELHGERLVTYSLGNFATYGRFNLRGPQGVGVILEAVLDGRGRFVEGKLIPTLQADKGIPQPDPDGQALTQVRELSRADFPETYVVVGEDGTLRAGAAPVMAEGQP